MKTISIILLSLQKLHSRLYILSKPTEDLVSQYLSDLAQLQPRDDDERGGGGGEEETFGMLHFSVAYLKDRSTLFFFFFFFVYNISDANKSNKVNMNS